MATSAVQEGVLEEMMDKVSAMWAKTEFEVRNILFSFHLLDAPVHSFSQISENLRYLFC